jgi:hypothetical protein
MPTQLTGDELARQLARLAIATFGSVRASDEDVDALANELTLHAVTWINTRFDLGLPGGDHG